MRPTFTRVAAAALLATGAFACASIWGFQDPVDRVDAGGDGAVEATAGRSDDAKTGDGPEDRNANEAIPNGDAVAMANDAAREASLEASAADGSAVEAAVRDASNDVSSAVDAPDAPGQKPCATICVPPVPSLWNGPYEIFEGSGTPPPTLPSCAAGSFPLDVYDGVGSPNAPPASCTCACGSPSGVACSAPVATFFGDGMCTQTCGGPTTIDLACAALTNCSHWVLGDSSPQGGTCTPSATKTVIPATWTATARLCGTASAPAASGCSAGMLCVPQAVVSSTGYCVARAGSGYSCPAGYPVMKAYFGASADTRDCTRCSCGGATGVLCTGATVTGYMDAACTKKPVAVGVPASCAGVNYQSAQLSPATPTGGSCGPLGGQPTGTFMPMTQTTMCCTQ